MSTLKPVVEDTIYAGEEDAIINLKGNSISIHRSDGVKHDLVTVFNKTGITGVVEDAVNSSTAKLAAKSSAHTEDRGKISINRSDGKHHDIGAVLRSQSELNMSSSTKSKFSWQSFKPKISFTKNPSPSTNLAEKRPSLSFSKEMANFHPSTVRIVHMSDTFNLLRPSSRHAFLPDGDILVHSGNFTVNGSDDEFSLFDSWLASVKDVYHYRVICLGHRDVKRFGTEYDVMKALLPNATHVLCHEEATILGIRFYVAPWHWGYNFNYTLKQTAPQSAATRLNDIPDNVDVLVTHGPAFGRLDRTIEGEQWGSRELADALKRVKPLVHLHGHVTEARGYIPAFGHAPLTLNSALCDRSRRVLYTCPHVVKCTQIFNPSDCPPCAAVSPKQSSSSSTAWEFALDALVA
jgi:hypothetical protein